MSRALLAALLLAAAALAVPGAAANPPQGTDCVGTYEPEALLNVCFNAGEGGEPQTVTIPGVGFASEHVCIIGQTCADVPVPVLTPGSTGVTVPGTPGAIDVDSLYVEADPGTARAGFCAGGQGVFVGAGAGTFNFCVVSGPLCVYHYNHETRERGTTVACA